MKAASMLSINRELYKIAVNAVLLKKLVSKNICLGCDGSVQICGGKAVIPPDCNIQVVAFGKASLGMAAGAAEVLGTRILGGVVSAPHGSGPSALDPATWLVFRGAVGNLPDETAEAAATEIEARVAVLGEKDVLLVLVSGGGSALLPAPIEGLRLAEKREAIRVLAAAGADIRALNTLRTHLSRLKGGRLASIAFPAKVMSLIFSDVLGATEGRALEFVGSGPTVEPTTTPADARDLCRRFGLAGQLPEVMAKLDDTRLAPWSEALRASVLNVCIGSNAVALSAAKDAAELLGFTAIVVKSDLEGEAKNVGRDAADLILSLLTDKTPIPDNARSLLEPQDFSVLRQRPLCLLWGGGFGSGGRSQELALSALLRLCESPLVLGDWAFSALGSDGQDGPNDAAGASFDAQMLQELHGDDRMRSLGSACLSGHDSHRFWATFEEGRGHEKPGLTGTNVMDFLILTMS